LESLRLRVSPLSIKKKQKQLKMKALKIKTIKTQVSTSGGEGKYRILQTLLKNTSISTKSITFGPILMSKD
tara:strand:- start:2288 stop:2500 length:213 start_codon:yes stop_codon:yes gene_type:complete